MYYHIRSGKHPHVQTQQREKEKKKLVSLSEWVSESLWSSTAKSDYNELPVSFEIPSSLNMASVINQSLFLNMLKIKVKTDGS